MNEENINYQGTQNVNGVPPQQPIPQDQGVMVAQQPVTQTPAAAPAPTPEVVQSVPQQPQEFSSAPALQPEVVQVPVEQPAPSPVPVQQPVFQQAPAPQEFASQPMQSVPPVAPPPPQQPIQQAPNNGVYSPSGPINGIDNVGFIAVGQPIKKKKNKGLLVFIGLVVAVLLGLLIYFVAFPFVIKTFLNDPKNIFDVTITNLTKSINTNVNSVFYDKAIYSISLDLDTNIEALDTFSGYNYTGRIGIDPTNEFFEYSYGVKDQYDKDYSYASYIKNGKVYERYSTYDGLLFLGQLDDYKNNQLKEFFEEYRDTIKQYGQDNSNYLINKISVLFIESIDSNKLVKEDASISINNKFIKTINNKYILDKENLQRTKKYIIEGLMNDEKSLEIISNATGMTQAELKLDMIEEADAPITSDEEIVLSIYTYGANSEIVGIEIQQAQEFKLQYFFKDGNFNTFIYTKSVINNETTEKTYNIDGVRIGDTTNVTMMSDNKKYITLKITDIENGKSIDYNLHEELFADEYNAQVVTAIAGNLTYKNDLNDKRNKYTIDFSIKNKDDYLKTSIVATIDWNSEVANINTNDISVVDRYTVKNDFENQLYNRTPLGMGLSIID